MRGRQTLETFHALLSVSVRNATRAVLVVLLELTQLDVGILEFVDEISYLRPDPSSPRSFLPKELVSRFCFRREGCDLRKMMLTL